MEIPPGGSLFPNPSNGASACAQSFCVPTVCEYKKFKHFCISRVWVFSPRHDIPTTELHSQNDRVPFVRPRHLPKFWGKKPKTTTDPNEPPNTKQ